MRPAPPRWPVVATTATAGGCSCAAEAETTPLRHARPAPLPTDAYAWRGGAPPRQWRGRPTRQLNALAGGLGAGLEAPNRHARRAPYEALNQQAAESRGKPLPGCGADADDRPTNGRVGMKAAVRNVLQSATRRVRVSLSQSPSSGEPPQAADAASTRQFLCNGYVILRLFSGLH